MGLLGLCLIVQAQAQYAPAAGLPGTTAIHKDSSILLFGADSVWISLGLVQKGDSSLGYPTVGNNNSAIGLAGENGVVSLGDGGVATAWFRYPIRNLPGYDFAVFENGFEVPGTGTWHMELAFVEVSNDGKRFYRFPSSSLTDTSIQKGNFEGMNPAQVNNLAGKYIGGYGTPFELDALKDSLDVNFIQFVRVIDVVGSINPEFATRDAIGRIINDPWPTPYPSSGFDLDAIVSIHAVVTDGLGEDNRLSYAIAPNPVQASGQIQINGLTEMVQVSLVNLQGKLIHEFSLNPEAGFIAPNEAGIYLLHVSSRNGTKTIKLIVQP